jgi:hypothetical protein
MGVFSCISPARRTRIREGGCVSWKYNIEHCPLFEFA